jgi:hypothetical protein
MTHTLHHLEKFPAFLRRAVELNRVHNPDDPLHDTLRMDPDAWHALAEREPDPDPATPFGQASAARKALVAIHKEFPGGAPVHEQAAYLVRAFAGLQPLGQGDFGTGWDLMAETLEHHRFELLAESEEGRTLANDLWQRMQAAYPHGFARKHLLERDDVLAYLSEWFRPRIVPVRPHRN